MRRRCQKPFTVIRHCLPSRGTGDCKCVCMKGPQVDQIFSMSDPLEVPDPETTHFENASIISRTLEQVQKSEMLAAGV